MVGKLSRFAWVDDTATLADVDADVIVELRTGKFWIDSAADFGLRDKTHYCHLGIMLPKWSDCEGLCELQKILIL